MWLPSAYGISIVAGCKHVAQNTNCETHVCARVGAHIECLFYGNEKKRMRYLGSIIEKLLDYFGLPMLPLSLEWTAKEIAIV